MATPMWQWSAVDAAAAIRDGRASSEEVVQAHIDRMHAAKLSRIAAKDARHAAEPERRNIFANECTRLGVVIDKQCESCAPRQRLDAECAGAGEQVKDAGAGERVIVGVHQNVEQRLAQPIGGGTDRRRFWAGQCAASQPSAHHAHHSMIPKSGHRFSEKIMLKQ